jgi:hypothetical protein
MYSSADNPSERRRRRTEGSSTQTLTNVGRLLRLNLVALLAVMMARSPEVRADSNASSKLFNHTNLLAWCIVPFDSKKRGPEERATMLEKLGIKRLAYDYRAEHIPSFDAEMDAIQRHHIELVAWWFPTELNEEGRKILDVLQQNPNPALGNRRR